VTIATAKRYPTVADAIAAGYQRVGPYLPGIGAHFIHLGAENFNLDGVMDDADLEHPLALIYEGTAPDDRLAGFMYYSLNATEPEGFAGPNDHWHYHPNLCVAPGKDGIDLPFGADQEVTPQQCEAHNGRLLPVTGYMLHVWNVPGWENPDGTFAELHPKITCRDGTYYTIPLDKVGTNSTVCRDEAVLG